MSSGHQNPDHSCQCGPSGSMEAMTNENIEKTTKMTESTCWEKPYASSKLLT